MRAEACIHAALPLQQALGDSMAMNIEFDDMNVEGVDEFLSTPSMFCLSKLPKTGFESPGACMHIQRI